MDKIIIGKDHIRFGEHKVFPPFKTEYIDAILGEPIVEEWDIEFDAKKRKHYVKSLWNDHGIEGIVDIDAAEYTGFVVYVEDCTRMLHQSTGTFSGQLFVGKTDYKQCKMKRKSFVHEAKCGCFGIVTFLINEIDEIDQKFRSIAINMSNKVEITYIPPKIQPIKYKLNKSNEPICMFDSFNFKLLVLEQLMYSMELLQPKFDIYEFAKEYAGRDINVDEEGYGRIKEAQKWFKDIDIPLSLASKIYELVWDGGLNVFHQIIPFWDGEDDFFTIKKLSTEELSQFKNLKRIVAGTGFSNSAIQTIANQGIKIE